MPVMTAAALPIDTDACERPRRLFLIRGGGGSPATARVALAARQPVVRAGLRAFLDPDERIAVVGEAAAAEETLALARRMHTGTMLVATDLPGMSCPELVARIRGCSEVAVVLVASSEDEPAIPAAMEAGARAVIARDAVPADVVRAVLVLGRQHRRPRVTEVGAGARRRSLVVVHSQGRPAWSFGT